MSTAYYSNEARVARMQAAQRAGYGLRLDDGGWWTADYLQGEEKRDAETRANAELAKTHRFCPGSGRSVHRTGNSTDSCLECGQSVGIFGAVSPHLGPHTVRIPAE